MILHDTETLLFVGTTCSEETTTSLDSRRGSLLDFVPRPFWFFGQHVAPCIVSHLCVRDFLLQHRLDDYSTTKITEVTVSHVVS